MPLLTLGVVTTSSAATDTDRFEHDTVLEADRPLSLTHYQFAGVAFLGTLVPLSTAAKAAQPL